MLSGCSVTVHEHPTAACARAQITYENDDESAASELASSLKEASGSPMYVPNFGQVEVTGVSELDAPVVPAITRHVCSVYARGLLLHVVLLCSQGQLSHLGFPQAWAHASMCHRGGILPNNSDLEVAHVCMFVLSRSVALEGPGLSMLLGGLSHSGLSVLVLLCKG